MCCLQPPPCCAAASISTPEDCAQGLPALASLHRLTQLLLLTSLKVRGPQRPGLPVSEATLPWFAHCASSPLSQRWEVNLLLRVRCCWVSLPQPPCYTAPGDAGGDDALQVPADGDTASAAGGFGAGQQLCFDAAAVERLSDSLAQLRGLKVRPGMPTARGKLHALVCSPCTSASGLSLLHCLCCLCAQVLRLTGMAEVPSALSGLTQLQELRCVCIRLRLPSCGGAYKPHGSGGASHLTCTLTAVPSMHHDCAAQPAASASAHRRQCAPAHHAAAAHRPDGPAVS